MLGVFLVGPFPIDHRFYQINPMPLHDHPTNKLLHSYYVGYTEKQAPFLFCNIEPKNMLSEGRIQWNSIIQEQSGRSRAVIKQENNCYAILESAEVLKCI